MFTHVYAPPFAHTRALQAAASTAVRIHESEPLGDILIFLPTAEDIEEAIRQTQDALRSSSMRTTITLTAMPLYAALPIHLQTAPFTPSPPNTRKAIFATSIAETSITLPNVSYVVDCGFVKQPYFDAEKGFERLVVTKVSQSSAMQRAGRAGRTKPGKCFRLYTREGFVGMDRCT